MKLLTYAEALREAFIEEMSSNPKVFIYGLGVDDPIGMYGTTKDLHVQFGSNRCFDTPLSEDAMTGFGVGAAMAGMRPIHVHQRMDFLLLCMNQLINMAAKMSYMSNGKIKVPMVVRAIIGRSWGQGAQHSQSFHSFFINTPGIKVVAPTTPYDAKGCMIASIRDNSPTIFLEHRMLYKNKGIVPSGPYEITFGAARVLCEGSDITILGISHMVVECLRAQKHLNDMGVSAEIIDPVSLSPLDTETIVKSVVKTGKLLVVDNGWGVAGAASEIIASTVMALQNIRVIKVERMGYAFSPCPTTKPLENEFYPNGQTIASKAYEMIKKISGWIPKPIVATEIEEFKGPF